MKDKDKDKNKKILQESDSNMVVSSTECTGLIPTPPLSEDEAESYDELYDIPLPKDKAINGQH